MDKCLVICPSCHVQSITSTTKIIELNEDARKIITQIKLKQSDEIRKEILDELAEQTQDLHNTTINNEGSAEIELLKKENILLKQMLDEMKDKNNILKDLNETQKSILSINNTNKSYAEVTRIKPTHQSQPQKIPKIIVKVNEANYTAVKEQISMQLTTDKTIQTKSIYNKNGKEMIITCMNTDSVKKAENLLMNKINNCELEIEQLNKPKIKIVGIDNSTNMNMEDMQNDINERNFKDHEDKGKVLHTYINKKNNLTSIIMEVSAEIYKVIRENNNKIFIGYQYCRVYDLINITPCFNCGRLGHNGMKCRNDAICLKCSEKHKTKECKSVDVKCTNCTYSNRQYNTKYDTEHSTSDQDRCEILLRKIKKYIDSTDYPIKPIIQNKRGKTDLKVSYQQQNKTQQVTQQITPQAKTTQKILMANIQDIQKRFLPQSSLISPKSSILNKTDFSPNLTTNR